MLQTFVVEQTVKVLGVESDAVINPQKPLSEQGCGLLNGDRIAIYSPKDLICTKDCRLRSSLTIQL